MTHDKDNCGTCADLDRLKKATREQLQEWIICAETEAAHAKVKREETQADLCSLMEELKTLATQKYEQDSDPKWHEANEWWRGQIKYLLGKEAK